MNAAPSDDSPTMGPTQGDDLAVPTRPDPVQFDNAALDRLDAIQGVPFPRVIGRYQVIEKIGSGGMGVVLKAEQQTPVRRIVAIKVIKLGMDSKGVMARFEAEQRALEVMDHPHIAKVLDAGQIDENRPYFVMEYVPGEPITDYCDRQKVNLRDRLKLFRDICSAVQHAHMKGIIHRDLKPSNVLICIKDGQPCVKVIDFGLAKALQGRLSTQANFTEFGQIIGTPEYMSPEQAEMSHLDIDTRTDIYGLGVMLYELLTGCLPFDPRSLREAGYLEIQRIIREEAPPRPSVRLSSLGAAAKTIAEKRRMELSQLTSQLYRELEWIPLKAMRKDRTERYQTAADLGQDVTNYLEGQPLTAGPESAIYRVKKLILRNKGAFATTVTACLLIVTGITLYVTAIRQEQRKTDQARQLAEHEQHLAGQQRDLAVQLAEKNAKLAGANGDLARERGDLAGRLRHTLSETDARIGHLLLEQDHDDEALAFEARALQEDPSNQTAVADSIAMLCRRSIPMRLFRHDNTVACAVFSPDGTRVVTASWDNTARISDVATGRPVGEAMRHTGRIVSAAFSTDGTRVITASWDRTAQVWDAATGKPIGSPLRHGSWVVSAAFSQDGTRVVTASQDCTAQVWEAATGLPLGKPMRHDIPDGLLISAAFNPDATRVVTASWDKAARIWDPSSGKLVGQPMQHAGVVQCATFSPDGKRVVTAGDNMGRVWDAQTGKLLQQVAESELVSSAAFSPEGKRILTVSGSTARIWDSATGKPLGVSMRHWNAVLRAEFSTDGLRIVTAGADNVARMWDAATSKPLGEPMRHERSVISAVFNSDGTRVVTASQDNTARIWCATTGKTLVEPMHHGQPVYFATFGPNGARVVTASKDQTAQVWDATTGKPLGAPMRHEADVVRADFSADGARVVTASSDRTARVWDAATGRPLSKPMHHDRGVRCAVFDREGKRVLTASSDGTAQIWDAATGKALGEPMRHEAPVFSAAFSPDGTRVVTACGDVVKSIAQVRLWSAKTSKPIGEPMRHQRGGVNYVSFSPDGKRLVSAGMDKVAQVWDATTGAPLGQALQHQYEVFYATFSPDGARVLTVSGESAELYANLRTGAEARIWDWATGKALGEPMRHIDVANHEHLIHFAAFSPDGTRVVTAGKDGTARIWDVFTGKRMGEFLRHEGAVWSAIFSPDGNRVLTASEDKTAMLWDVAVPVPSASAFLENLNHLATNRQLGPGGYTEPLPDWFATHTELTRQAGLAAMTQPSAQWMSWFLADHSHRSISPFSQLSVRDWTSNRLEESTPDMVSYVWEIAPDNPRCLARRARTIVSEIRPMYSDAVPIYMELYSRRAVDLAPADAEVLWRRAAILAWLGHGADATLMFQRCPEPMKNDLWAWEAKWEALMLLKRGAEALGSLTVAQQLAQSRPQSIRDSLKQWISSLPRPLPPGTR